MRFGTSLVAALVLAGSLGNTARAQSSGNSTASRQSSGYTGPYSVYGPGLTYRQDSSYTGPYSGRLGSNSGTSSTRSDTYSSLRSAAMMNQTGQAKVQSDEVTRSDAGRVPAAGRPRYVRISMSGNAIQAIVVP